MRDHVLIAWAWHVVFVDIPVTPKRTSAIATGVGTIEGIVINIARAPGRDLGEGG